MWRVKEHQIWYYGETLRELRLQLERHFYPMGEIDWILERAKECSAPTLLLIQRETDRWQIQFEGFTTFTGELVREAPNAYRLTKYGGSIEVIVGEEVPEYLRKWWPDASGYEIVALNGKRRVVKTQNKSEARE